jgi:hypothetical protein
VFGGQWRKRSTRALRDRDVRLLRNVNLPGSSIAGLESDMAFDAIDEMIASRSTSVRSFSRTVIPDSRFKNVEGLLSDVIFNGIKTGSLTAEGIKPLPINKRPKRNQTLGKNTTLHPDRFKEMQALGQIGH